jgi:hypothetical protein
MHVTTMARVVMTVTVSLLAAACSGGRNETPTGPSVPVPLPAAASGTITGIITDERGARLPGVVWIIESPGGGRIALANGNGEYTFGGVPAGFTLLRASAKAMDPVEKPVMVTAGTTRLDFTLSPLPKDLFTGSVTDIDTGAGIAGATVQILRDTTTDVVDDWGRSTTTNAQGVFAFDRTTLGTLIVSATAPGYQERRIGQNIRATPTMTVALRRDAVPQTLTGVVGWTEPLPCSYRAGTADYACVQHPFTMRRAGSVDVVVTWEGSTETSVLVQLIDLDIQSPIFPSPRILREVRGAPGSRRITFNQGIFRDGRHAWRIVNIDSFRLPGGATPANPPIPYTLVYTIGD